MDREDIENREYSVIKKVWKYDIKDVLSLLFLDEKFITLLIDAIRKMWTYDVMTYSKLFYKIFMDDGIFDKHEELILIDLIWDNEFFNSLLENQSFYDFIDDFISKNDIKLSDWIDDRDIISNIKIYMYNLLNKNVYKFVKSKTGMMILDTFWLNFGHNVEIINNNNYYEVMLLRWKKYMFFKRWNNIFLSNKRWYIFDEFKVDYLIKRFSSWEYFLRVYDLNDNTNKIFWLDRWVIYSTEWTIKNIRYIENKSEVLFIYITYEKDWTDIIVRLNP
jgi:hypothetical protein